MHRTSFSHSTSLTLPCADATLTILPHPCSYMYGIDSLMAINADVRLMAMTKFHFSSGMSSTADTCCTPACTRHAQQQSSRTYSPHLEPICCLVDCLQWRNLYSSSIGESFLIEERGYTNRFYSVTFNHVDGISCIPAMKGDDNDLYTSNWLKFPKI